MFYCLKSERETILWNCNTPFGFQNKINVDDTILVKNAEMHKNLLTSFNAQGRLNMDVPIMVFQIENLEINKMYSNFLLVEIRSVFFSTFEAHYQMASNM